MADLDQLLRRDISESATDAVELPDFVPIERRGLRRRRTHRVLAGAAAAVVAAVVAAGASYVTGSDNSAPQPVSPGEPTPSVGSMPSGDGARSQPIQPGTYRVPRSVWSAAEFTITFPERWTVQYGHIYHAMGARLTLEAAAEEDVFTDACREPAVPMDVGPGVQDLVDALRRQRGPVVSRPVETTLGGHPATRVDLRVPERLDLRDCRLWNDGGSALQVWYSRAADNYFVLFPDAVASVYVLDVDGRRQVFVAQNRAPDSAQARARLQEVVDSIRIEE